MEVEVKVLLQAFASRAASGDPLPDAVLYIYECPLCGPVYLTHDTDNDDRDSLVGAPRKPAPAPGASAVAVPEPDEYDATEVGVTPPHRPRQRERG
jgi:hypothetical protein